MSLVWVGSFLGEEEGGGGVAMFDGFLSSLNNLSREREREFWGRGRRLRDGGKEIKIGLR